MKKKSFLCVRTFVFAFLALGISSFLSATENLSNTTWQNKNRVIRFAPDENVLYIRLKNYYGLWLDSEYKVDFDFQKNPLLILNGDLYISYWKESEKTENYYLPCTNFSEITLDEHPTAENVYGYYFTENDFYEVRYWKCSKDIFDEEKMVELTEGQVLEKIILIPKFIRIADDFYTCVPGRGVKLRNKIKTEKNDFFQRYEDFRIFDIDGISYMVTSKPYLKQN